jgi:transcription elongation factor GreA-like protein
MDICGEVVVHKTFGVGQIIDFKNNYITVRFETNKAEKIFVYPSAFGSFLEIENETFLAQIKSDKDLIDQALAKNQRINEELKKFTAPIASIKIKSKPKKVTTIKSSD